METSGSEEAVTKTFRLKQDAMNRLAFYVTPKTGATFDDIEYAWRDSYTCQDCNDDANYYIVGPDGNAAVCQAHTVTDGTEWWNVATDSVSEVEEAALNAKSRTSETRAAWD